jgi:hypothetical protein
MFKARRPRRNATMRRIRILEGGLSTPFLNYGGGLFHYWNQHD